MSALFPKADIRPRRFDEIEGDGLSLINEPVPPVNVSTLARMRARALHAVLVESLIHTQALLTRLETIGVYVPRDHQREIVRELYVQLATSCERYRTAWRSTGWSEGRGCFPAG